MINNVHDTDDYFQSAYRQFEEEPSSAVWEKIDAALDKKDAKSNKIQFIVWRRAAIVLAMVLAGFLLYNSKSSTRIHTHGNRFGRQKLSCT